MCDHRRTFLLHLPVSWRDLMDLQKWYRSAPTLLLLDVESNKLWGWQHYSILVKGVCSWFWCFFTNRHSWLYFPRCGPQRFQADIIDEQFVPLQQYSKNWACSVFLQESWWTRSWFAETYLCSCDFHGLGWGFASPFQAISSQLIYGLGQYDGVKLSPVV